MDKEKKIYEACRDGNLEEVRKNISEGIDVNFRIGMGYRSVSPLHIAAKNGHIDIIKELLDNGADIEIKDESGLTPLLNSNFYNKNESTKFLLKRGANIYYESNYGIDMLCTAAGFNNIEILQILLDEYKMNIETINKCGQTPLWRASFFGELEVVKELLKRGANINAVDEANNTCLLVACSNGHLNVVRELLFNGANTTCNLKYDLLDYTKHTIRDEVRKIIDELRTINIKPSKRV